MNCLHCKRPGEWVASRTTRQPPHCLPFTGNRFAVFQCNNPACRFTFRSFIDGGRRDAQPRWMYPIRWMENAQPNGGGAN